MTLHRHVDEEQIQRFLDGALSAREVDDVERHAGACADCRAALESYRMLAAALDDLPLPELPEGFTEGVLSRIEASERSAARERRWALGIIATVLAATVAVFVAAGASAWAPAISSAADALGGSVRAFRIGSCFVPQVVSALRMQIVLVAAILALPLVVALARLVPALRTETV